MQHKILPSVRLIIALIIAILCFLTFFGYSGIVPIFDIQFTAALQRFLISGATAALAILAGLIIITLIFGRIYCSTLCPLGLYQEFLTFLFKPFHRTRKNQPNKHHVFAYFVAAILFGSLSVGTVVLLRMLDPYSVAGNAFSGAAFGLAFLFLLTILVFFKKRFFCTNICPVGAVLGILSRFSLFKIRFQSENCKTCGLCTRSCPCDAIDFKNHTVNNETCIKCFKCLTPCKHNALTYSLPRAEKVAFNISRRQFITAAAVLATFYVSQRINILTHLLPTRKKAILPAGANSIEDFSNRCLNCNLCVRNCPQKIIKPATVDTPFIHIEYGDSSCAYDCHKCSAICPSGALEKISLSRKQKTKIANVGINEEICIKCGLCASACPRQAITKENAEPPLIRFDECIGCGACAAACPVKAIFIEPVDEQIVLN